MNVKSKILIITVLFFITAHFSYAQSGEDSEQLYTRRIVWSEGEHIYRYAVDIQRLVSGRYRSHSRVFTTDPFVEVSLPLGEYRFSIIPYDILDRPSEGTRWMSFVIRHTPPSMYGDEEVTSIVSNEVVQITEREPPQVTPSVTPTVTPTVTPSEADDQKKEEVTGLRRFNTLGLSLGSAFTDPAVIASIHGTYSPIRSGKGQGLFLELGCDFGFLSVQKDVDAFFCVNPFINIGYFIPFKRRGGFFVGSGIGYIYSTYTFPYGKADNSTFGVNLSAGFNFFNFLNLSYGIKTNFKGISNKLMIGYVYRFKNLKAKNSELNNEN